MQNIHKKCCLTPLSRALIAIMLIFSTASCGGKSDETAPEAAQEVSVIKIAPRDIDLSAEFIGETKGAVDADVRARVEGVILKIHFKDGTHVKEGDPLYDIDPKPFEAKLAEANAKLAEATTLLVKAQSDLQRIRPLAEMKAVSARDLDAAIAGEGVAQGGVAAATAGVTSAEIELGYTKITAPVSGLIGITKARVGEFVGRHPNVVVLNTVSQLDPIHVRFTVTEKDYLYFARLKQKAEQSGQNEKPRELKLVLSDGSEHSEKGHLVSVDSQIDATTGSLTAEAAFSNPDLILRPGQFAKLQTTRDKINNAIIIPKRSIRELQGLQQVLVVTPDNLIELKTIKLGAELGGDVVVSEGLSAGEMLVSELQAGIKSGMRVNPKVIS